MKKLTGIALLAGLMALPQMSNAAIPKKLNFQGRLADGSGTPLTGSYSVQFRIWNASSGGTACHDQTMTVAVNSGLFNVNIGDINTASCPFDVPYWLGLKFDTDSEMTPRLALVSTAYALRADNADKLAGKSAGNLPGDIPISNGTVNQNLNADLLDGLSSADIMPSKPLYKRHDSCMLSERDIGDLGSGLSSTDECLAHYTGASSTNCATVYTQPTACPAGCVELGVGCNAATFTVDLESKTYAVLCTQYMSLTCYRREYRRYCSCTNPVYGYVKP